MPDKSGGKRRPEMLPPMRIYNLEEELRRCAFEIYVDCGPEGHDVDDCVCTSGGFGNPRKNRRATESTRPIEGLVTRGSQYQQKAGRGSHRCS
jgi:hypothetical protein